MTKYEALEKNAVSEPEMPQPGDLHYSRNSRKPHFIGRFSAYSLMEKLGGRNEWRRGRDSNPRYGSRGGYADQQGWYGGPHQFHTRNDISTQRTRSISDENSAKSRSRPLSSRS